MTSFLSRLVSSRRVWCAVRGYLRSHEYLTDDNKVGISKRAASKLGEVVYIDMPNIGATTVAGQVLLSLESIKATSDVYSPASGRVIEINTKALDDPSLITSDPEGEGWLVRLHVNAVSPDVLSVDDYEKSVK